MSGTDAGARRFLRVLVRAGRAERMASGSFVAESGSIRASLAEAEIKALSARGLVRLDGDICRPTGDISAHLRGQRPEGCGTAAQHRLLAPGPEGTVRDLCGNPLEKLNRSTGEGFLAPHQVEAGRRVCVWGERAQLRQRVTMSYDAAQVGGRRQGGGSDLADMAVEARKSLARLYTDLPRDCAETIVDVCVFEKGLQTIEAERGWPRRSAKLVLRIGLEQLAIRLGLGAAAKGKPSARLVAWLDESFAPTRFE